MIEHNSTVANTGTCVLGDMEILLQPGEASVVNTEPTVARIRGKLCELRMSHVDQCLVIPAFQIDFWLVIDTFVDHNIETVAFADWWHSAARAIPKQLVDLAHVGEIDQLFWDC